MPIAVLYAARESARRPAAAMARPSTSRCATICCGRDSRTACTSISTVSYRAASSNSTMPTVCVSACLVPNSSSILSLFRSRNSANAPMPHISAILWIDAAL